jgi:hypothetical protein
VSFSARNLDKLGVSSKLNFHRSKSVGRRAETSSSVLSITPSVQLSIAEDYACLVSTAGYLKKLCTILPLEWINKKWGRWFDEAGISDSKLTFNISSEGKQEPISWYEWCVMVTARYLANDYIERERFRLIAELLWLILLLVFIVCIS